MLMATKKAKTAKKTVTKARKHNKVSKTEHAHVIYLLVLCAMAIAVVFLLFDENM